MRWFAGQHAGHLLQRACRIVCHHAFPETSSAQYEEALASRVLRRPGSVLAACCGARAGGGYMASARAELRDLVKPSGKRLWASEFGCGTAPLNDMAAGVALSAVILQVTARLV